MANLREEVPAEFADDERWYKYFTKTTLIVLIIAILFTWVMAKLFGLFHMEAFGLIIGICIGGTVFGIFNIRIPAFDTLHGGGTGLSEIIYRILVKRKNGKIMARYPEDARGGI